MNAYQQFSRTAFGPVFYNSLVVSSLLIFGAPNESAVRHAAIGITISAAAYFVFQAALGRRQLSRFRPSLDVRDDGFRRLLWLAVPTLISSGGADKIATFISLMRGNELSTVCLLDTFTDQGAEVRLKRMVEQKIIADKKILYYHSVIEQTFADIEDLFSKEEYLALYNGAFGTSVQISDLNANKPIMSQLAAAGSEVCIASVYSDRKSVV